jgi:hypothetical protein
MTPAASSGAGARSAKNPPRADRVVAAITDATGSGIEARNGARGPWESSLSGPAAQAAGFGYVGG